MAIEHGEIMGIQIRDMVLVADQEDPIYRGDLYLDGVKIGSFEEDQDGGPTAIYVDSDASDSLRERMDSFFAKEGFSVQEEEDYDLFFIRLIELEQLLQVFLELPERGMAYLVADYTDEEMVVYEVENDMGLDQLILEGRMEDYDVYRSLEDFVIS
ncbi:hypothetical protein [Dethiosulfovibrio salsuginis]|uniref:Uncharacterized protein n=1 Tax=Dethiosulfovibrio salsuginis TaxID=561720 RepID=A0A1X7KES0_9BACT|nr:hypothetical protein [Dethiosulfovibrio salsuginis]SMG39456.1 hypothetical protein SAMN06275492_12617 [Dethiosulfovibrio salsuginis]